MCSPYRVASNSERAFRGTRGASYHELRKRGTKVVPGIMNRRYGSPSCAGRSASKTRVDALVSRASTCSEGNEGVDGRDRPRDRPALTKAKRQTVKTTVSKSTRDHRSDTRPDRRWVTPMTRYS